MGGIEHTFKLFSLDFLFFHYVRSSDRLLHGKESFPDGFIVRRIPRGE